MHSGRNRWRFGGGIRAPLNPPFFVSTNLVAAKRSPLRGSRRFAPVFAQLKRGIREDGDCMSGLRHYIQVHPRLTMRGSPGRSGGRWLHHHPWPEVPLLNQLLNPAPGGKSAESPSSGRFRRRHTRSAEQVPPRFTLVPLSGRSASDKTSTVGYQPFGLDSPPVLDERSCGPCSRLVLH